MKTNCINKVSILVNSLWPFNLAHLKQSQKYELARLASLAVNKMHRLIKFCSK